MRTVEFRKHSGQWFRWEARTTDSHGIAVNGVGFTKDGALRELKRRAKRREEWINRAPPVPGGTQEVDW